VIPRCPHFGTCGGCSLQHLDPEHQILAKQETLEQNLARIGGLSPAEWFPPLTGPLWHYRRKARLSVRYVFKKERVLVGFRERLGRYVADMSECHVLEVQIAECLPQLADLIRSLDGYRRIPQVEVACGDEVSALVFRHLDPLSPDDQGKLRQFAVDHRIGIFLQPAGPASIHPLEPSEIELSYALPGHDISLRFGPSDFIQVNGAMNRLMIDRAIELLALQAGERVLDLFCGLGNFTLPLAKHAGQAVGVEGEAGLVQRARDNAARNCIENAEFHCADLTLEPGQAPWLRQPYDKVLIDPPRSGAEDVLPYVAASGASRLLYVSCHPASLARDAGILVRDHDFELLGAGVLDMFPHTAHVESVALFAR
jgi:23S rRNA (uracil1939-C5)-methyltransferase